VIDVSNAEAKTAAREQKKGTTGAPMKSYEKPRITDYGTLLDLTAASGLSDTEDGLGKILNTDGSHPAIP
jgi:hypothetical protein